MGSHQYPKDIIEAADAALLAANMKAHMLGEPTDPIECLCEAILAERQEGREWIWGIENAPKDRKICVLWKDIYSDNDEGGPKYSAGHTYWMDEPIGGLREYWANRPSSHWEAVAWCEFPALDRAELETKGNDNA